MNLKKSLEVVLAQRQIKQSKMIVDLSLSSGTVKNIKDGKNINTDTLRKICKYLDISISEFIAVGEDNRKARRIDKQT